MSVQATTIWKCDLCGATAEQARTIDGKDPHIYSSADLYPGWSLLRTLDILEYAEFSKAIHSVEMLVCPAHTISATHNGDQVTLRKGAL